MRYAGMDLSAIVARADELQLVRKADLRPGDQVLVRTHNSVYIIKVTDEGTYLVSGGWFDAKGLSPMRTTIAGCTWGGTVIKVDVVAACGLCLEFGNRLTTSAVQGIAIVPSPLQN